MYTHTDTHTQADIEKPCLERKTKQEKVEGILHTGIAPGKAAKLDRNPVKKNKTKQKNHNKDFGAISRYLLILTLKLKVNSIFFFFLRQGFSA